MARRSRVSLISRDNGEMLIYRGAVQAGRPGLHALIGGKYALRPGTAPVPPMETSINSPCGENLAEWTQSNLHLVDRSQNCRYVRARARVHMPLVRLAPDLALENLNRASGCCRTVRHSALGRASLFPSDFQRKRISRCTSHSSSSNRRVRPSSKLERARVYRDSTRHCQIADRRIIRFHDVLGHEMAIDVNLLTDRYRVLCCITKRDVTKTSLGEKLDSISYYRYLVIQFMTFGNKGT